MVGLIRGGVSEYVVTTASRSMIGKLLHATESLGVRFKHPWFEALRRTPGGTLEHIALIAAPDPAMLSDATNVSCAATYEAAARSRACTHCRTSRSWASTHRGGSSRVGNWLPVESERRSNGSSDGGDRRTQLHLSCRWVSLPLELEEPCRGIAKGTTRTEMGFPQAARAIRSRGRFSGHRSPVNIEHPNRLEV